MVSLESEWRHNKIKLEPFGIPVLKDVLSFYNPKWTNEDLLALCEGYFRHKFIGEGRYSRMGGWWDRKGENEIDLVCENEFRKTLDFYEVKRDRSRIDLNDLERKSKAFLDKNPSKWELKRTLSGLSLEDM